MSDLSSVSIRKIIQCMEIQNNITDLVNLRKSCFRLNQVAVENGFNKLQSSAFTLDLSQSSEAEPPTAELLAHLGLSLMELHKKMSNHNRLNCTNKRSYIEKMLERFDSKQKTYRVGPSENDINSMVEQAFTEALEKVRSVSKLRILEMTLNSGLLKTMKKFSSSIRRASSITFYDCTIECTGNELLRFLQLFDNLKSLSIVGKFKEPILTDQHLSLVSEQITIANESYDVLHFPGITSKSCENWARNRTQIINFENISTEISFVAAKYSAEKLKLNQGKFGSFDINFGIILNSDKNWGAIARAQRKRNNKWSIKKSSRKNDEYKVSSNRDRYRYKFQIHRPYEKQSFENLLATVHRIRGESEAGGNDPRDWQRLDHELFAVYAVLEDHQRRKNLPGLPFENRPHHYFDGGDGGQLGVQALANFYEQIIRQRIGELEEPVANVD